MKDDTPKLWPLKCPECGDRVYVELPVDAEDGKAGTAMCHRGHFLLYRYDGVTVSLLEVLIQR
ncbi:MAG: hypothetical protein WAU32_15390 [Thermoanaerobaculia bacterium]